MSTDRNPLLRLRECLASLSEADRRRFVVAAVRARALLRPADEREVAGRAAGELESP